MEIQEKKLNIDIEQERIKAQELIKKQGLRVGVGEQLYPFGEQQRAAALDAVHALVSRHGERIDAVFLHVDSRVSACLRAVAHGQDVSGQQGAHRRRVDGRSRHIGSEGKHRGNGVRFCRRRDRRRRNAPLLRLYEGEAYVSVPFQKEERPQHSVVFRRRTHHMRGTCGRALRRAQQSEQRNVQCFRAVFGQNDPLAAFSAQKVA